ncbi:MAG: hypothetical protein HY908_25560 [Myxococcales bacterium]|nr:hypothetical protein [Myxococcales bacterium]
MSGRGSVSGTSLDPRWQSVHEDGSPCPGEEHPAVITRTTGRPVSGTLMGVRRADGTTAWVLVNAQPLGAPGEARRRVVVSFADVALREATEQLRAAFAVNERLVSELREALKRVRTLSGLVPICAHCKKIRSDTGYWERIERYITEHTGAQFTHGICPDCAEQHFPELFERSASGSEPPGPSGEAPETEKRKG